MNNSVPALNKTLDFFHFINKMLIMIILVLLSLFLLSFFIYIGDAFLNNVLGRSKPPLFSTYVIVSESMVPTINVGDAIFVKRNDSDNYNIGEIITFTSDSRTYQGVPITHRIINKSKISKGKSIYVTKGDNNDRQDPFSIETSNICGKVLFTIPNFVGLQLFFSKPSNYFLCLLIVSFVFIIYELSRITIMMVKKKE